ncbi:MAG: cupin domain-containing protein [Pseudomonadota bacterium]|nr:cupin domain-containing protein [Pseudomonadota bacterium]
MRNIVAFLAGLILCVTVAEANEIIGAKDGKDIVTVRVTQAEGSKQQLPIFPGISGNTAGSKHLTLLKVVIPPGASAQAHVHKGYESAVYLLQGEVETRYGDKLEKSVVNKAGDFIFIPADVPHQPVNLSKTEAAIAIVARNDPNEQEHVVIYKSGEGK